MIDTLLYNGFCHTPLMLDVDLYKQTRVYEVEIENCVSCPMHHRKDSNLFYCEYSDMDMHYRDISDVTTFPKACSLVIGSLIRRYENVENKLL